MGATLDARPLQPLSAEAMRHAMVASQLRTSAVSDTRVIAAMAEEPRELYVPAGMRGIAYRDTMIDLGNGRRLNTPLATGRLLTEARLSPGDSVLLVGSASGYAAALLARLVRRVVAVESDAALVAQARAALEEASTVTLVEGPLEAGCVDHAPYDVLVIDGAVETLPAALAEQVRPGGRIVAGLVDRGVTRLAAGERTVGGFGLADFADVDCVVLPGFAVPRRFTF
ncbi:protein-L-isoaspartate O-methyltransferase family protein [Sphingomonas baiyangensis]